MRTALITGANRGIGKETARQLIAKDFFVYMAGRNPESLSVARNEIDPDNSSSDILVIDVADKDSIATAVSALSKSTSYLDVLINNAGIYLSPEGIINTDDQTLNEVLSTNALGPMQMCKAFLPFLKKGSSPVIINVSTGMSRINSLQGNYAAYRLSKNLLNAITIILADELKADKIKVVALDPGWVKTDMGGAGATRPVSKGAETIVWLAENKNFESGNCIKTKW